MRVLVTWGSRRGGTAEIGTTIAETLREHGYTVTAAPASEVKALANFDAAIIGGALYANVWHHDAYRFATRNIGTLRDMPVWLFSSGPLDNSANEGELPEPRQVSVLAERIGALEHVTFGGRLLPDAKDFSASAMARTHGGDWRDLDRARNYADDIAAKLPTARPGIPYEPFARSIWRLMGHAILGAIVAAATTSIAAGLLMPSMALGLHLLCAPITMLIVAAFYFTTRGAREPFPVAATFTIAVLSLDVVAALLQPGVAPFLANPLIELSALVLVFAGSWAIGRLALMWPTAEQRRTGWPKGEPKTVTPSRPRRI